MVSTERIKELEGMTTKQLLEVARGLNIVGRHEMRKTELIEALVKKANEVVAKYPEMVERLEQLAHEDVPDQVRYAAAGLEKQLLNGDSKLKPVGLFQSMEQHMIQNATHEWEPIAEGELDLLSLPKPKAEYIDNAKIGTIIAFTVNKSKVLSGMIEEIHKSDFLVRTKSGVLFTVRKKNVLWVRTGKRWPRGVYLAMKGETSGGKDYDTAGN